MGFGIQPFPPEAPKILGDEFHHPLDSSVMQQATIV